MLRQRFPDIKIYIDYMKEPNGGSYTNVSSDTYKWVESPEGLEMHCVFISLEILVDDIDTNAIRRDLVHEVSHLVEMYNRMIHEDNKDASTYVDTADNKSRGFINYERVLYYLEPDIPMLH